MTLRFRLKQGGKFKIWKPYNNNETIFTFFAIKRTGKSFLVVRNNTFTRSQDLNFVSTSQFEEL